MAELAYVSSKGEVEYKETDVGQALVDLPALLESLALDRLRYDGTTVVDADTETEFFIDDTGEKWLLNDAPNALEVSGTFTLYRRVAGDRIERATGSFVTDGFLAGEFVSVDGSASQDKPFKVLSVEATRLNLDNDFTRIDADENDVSVTLYQGWQRLEGLDFDDVMVERPPGLWGAKSDSENQDDAVKVFRTEVNALAAQWVTQQSPYPDRHRNPPEASAAAARIVQTGKDLSPPFGFGNLLIDVNTFGKDIYNQVAGSELAVSVSFVETGKKITRATGDFRTNFAVGQTLTTAGAVNSQNNSSKFTIIGFVGNGTEMLLGSDGSSLADEGPVTVDLTSISTVSAYAQHRNERDPEAVSELQWTRWMEEAVAIQWFSDVEGLRKDYVKGASSSDIWATTTVYAVGDIVFEPDSRLFYECNTAHTATTFQSDAANWDVYTAEGAVYPVYPHVQIES